jgi:hypothetical protein
VAVLAPLASPAFHRPLRDPQRGSDLPALRATLEASHSLEPAPLPCGPLGVGQAATLRISHCTRTTEATCALSGEHPDITRSSSVARRAVASILPPPDPQHVLGQDESPQHPYGCWGLSSFLDCVLPPVDVVTH